MAHAIECKSDRLRNLTHCIVLPELELFGYTVVRKNHSTDVINHMEKYWMMPVEWP